MQNKYPPSNFRRQIVLGFWMCKQWQLRSGTVAVWLQLDWSLMSYSATLAWNKHDGNWEAGAGIEKLIPSKNFETYINKGQVAQCLPPWCCSITTKSLHLGKNSNIEEIGCSSVMHPPRLTTIIINNTTLGRTICFFDEMTIVFS